MWTVPHSSLHYWQYTNDFFLCTKFGKCDRSFSQRYGDRGPRLTIWYSLLLHSKCLLRSVVSVQIGIMHISGTNVFVGIVVKYVMRVKAVLRRQKFWIYKKNPQNLKTDYQGCEVACFWHTNTLHRRGFILFSVLLLFILRPVFVLFILRHNFSMCSFLYP